MRVLIPRISPGLDMWWLLRCVIQQGSDTVMTDVTKTARENWSRVDLEILHQIKTENFKRITENIRF